MTVDSVDADVVVGGRQLHSLAPNPNSLRSFGRRLTGAVTEPLDEAFTASRTMRGRATLLAAQLPDASSVIGGQRDASLATEDTDVEETTPTIQSRLERLVTQLVGGTPRVTAGPGSGARRPT